MNEGWRERLSRRLDDIGIDMKAASRRADQNETFVRDVLKRGRIPSIDAFVRLAGAVETSPEWLLGGEDSESLDVPLLAGISAGRFRSQDGVRVADIERHIRVTGLPRGDWFALTVEGDSMNRIAPDGSVIIVNRADDGLVDRAFYVFALNDGDATFKRFSREPEPMLMPYSFNPDHPSIPVGDRDLYVFGRVRRIITDV